MRGRRIVVRPRHPVGQRENELESLCGRQSRSRQLISRLVQGDAIQPDNVIVVVSQLSMVPVMRPDRVRLQMPMDGRVGMVGIRLVRVLRRDRCQQGNVGRQNQGYKGAAEWKPHARTIMASGQSDIKQARMGEAPPTDREGLRLNRVARGRILGIDETKADKQDER